MSMREELLQKSLFWADRIVKNVIRSRRKDTYVVNDSKTPSGRIHVGSGRGWIMHDAVSRAFRDFGKDCLFYFGSDDMDPFDNVPSYLDAGFFEQHIGKALAHVPWPSGGNYADHFFNECLEKFPLLRIEPSKVYRASELYSSGFMNEAIGLVLEKAEKVREVYKAFGQIKPKDWLPVMVVCENCGKIATTLAFSWDGDVVAYRCAEGVVKFASGCGHEGEVEPFDGNAKLPWKIDWAAKWYNWGVDVEFAGKDLATKGGALDMAKAIARKVFEIDPPFTLAYEFFLAGGRKMSTSKGVGVSFVQFVEDVPPEIVRFLMVKTRPSKAIDFDPSKAVPVLFREFDRYERVYFGLEEIDNEKERIAMIRAYELTVVEPPPRAPKRVPFTFLATISQVRDWKGAIEVLKRAGHLTGDEEDWELEMIRERFEFARRWVEKYGGQFRVKLVDRVDWTRLSETERKALVELREKLKSRSWSYEALNSMLFDLARKYAGFFSLAYRALIGRDRGPRLASLILAFGPERIVKLLEEAPED